MSTTISKNNYGKTVLKVEGDLDSYERADDFKEALEGLYAEGETEVVLDLDGVERINSHGIGKVLMFYRRFRDRGGNLYVKAPLRGKVKENFETLRLNNILKEYEH